MVHFFRGRLENIVGKGENAGYKHFLLFLQCFQKHSRRQSTRLYKIKSIWRKKFECGDSQWMC